MNDNFELKKAYHAKQVAYDEMSNAREKLSDSSQALSDKYAEAEKLQAEYDVSKAKQDKAWQDYNVRQLEIKDKIAGKITAITECNILSDNLKLMSENPEEDPNKAEIYMEGSKFFATFAKQQMVERDNLITAKRHMPRPDNHASEQLLSRLKLVRAEHASILEEYHISKNEFAMKKRNFDRLNEKYNNILNGEFANTYTNRPERLEIDEGLLLNADIPEEHWHNCSIKKRLDGRIDIYYGADEDTSHGHVVMLGDEIEYARLPQPKGFVIA